MFVQLDIIYYVGIRSFRELLYISVVCSTKPGGPLKCFIFTLVGAPGVLMDFIESINFFFISLSFSVVNWFERLWFQM